MLPVDPEELRRIKEHDAFLRDIATKVDDLVRNELYMTHFRNRVKAFCEINEAHEKEVEPLEKTYKEDFKLQQAVAEIERQKWGKSVAEMTDAEAAELDVYYHLPPSPNGYEGYIWHNGCLIPPPKVPDLMEFLHSPIDIAESSDVEQDSWEASKPRNEEERLCCSYALVTAIHDTKIFENPIYVKQTYKGGWSCRDRWVSVLWQRCTYGPYPTFYIEETRFWIERALRFVEDEIKQQIRPEDGSVVTKQGTQLSKNGKKRGRPKTYTDEMLKKMQKAYEQLYGENNDSKGAWNKVADLFDVVSGDAARVASMNYHKGKKLKKSK